MPEILPNGLTAQGDNNAAVPAMRATCEGGPLWGLTRQFRRINPSMWEQGKGKVCLNTQREILYASNRGEAGL